MSLAVPHAQRMLVSVALLLYSVANSRLSPRDRVHMCRRHMSHAERALQRVFPIQRVSGPRPAHLPAAFSVGFDSHTAVRSGVEMHARSV
jgi:hypothetical protein